MALELRNVTLTQGEFHLSADVSMAKGGLSAVIGPSGAGKSTLFDAIAGFLETKTGQILLSGATLHTLPPGKRPIAMLFQDNNLFPHLNVQQNIGLALSHRRLNQDQIAQVGAVLGKVGLDGFGLRRLSELSGGQRSRVALARVLLQDRPLWLLDEPFAALGPALKKEMLALVKSMAAETGATVLMITHDPADAQAFADQVLLVADHRVTGPFDTEAVFADPPEALRYYL